MAGYTSEEKQEVIDRFLLGRVATPRTSLGARDVLSARDDAYSLLTTTLLLKPDSYFYIVWLAKNRLEALRRRQVEALTYVLSPATQVALARRGRPVRNTNDLTNAQAALVALNTSLNAGVVGAGSRELGPEVARFRRSVERFIRGELQPNVVGDGEVTETAGEVRARIRTLWEEVRARHNEMLVLGSAIQGAVSSLSGVRLPEKAVQDVVVRLRTRLSEITPQLEQDKTMATHREAMLELLVMRTLLSRISSFRTPREVLAPLTGDAQTLVGVRGDVPAEIVGTVSGPFNVAPGDNLMFESGSPVVPSNIIFGVYSNAEIRSREFATLPITFPPAAALQLRVDGTLYVNDSSFGGASFATVALLRDAIETYLITNMVPATTYVDGTQVVVRSNSAADSSSIELRLTTSPQLAFGSITGFTPYAVCSPVGTADVVALGRSFPGVLLSEARTEYGVLQGVTRPSSVLDLSKVGGTDLSGSGTQLSSTSTNFETAGVVPGDYLYIEPRLNDPPTYTVVPAEIHRVAAVRGGVLELETPLTINPSPTPPHVAVAGLSTYRIGADFSLVPPGTRVVVTSLEVPLNSGPYRVVLGDIGQLTLDRPFFVALDTSVSVNIFSSFLVARAPGTTPADGITAWPSSPGATAVGITPSATQVRGRLTEFDATASVDFLTRGVSVGDILTLDVPGSLGSTITEVRADSLSTDGEPHFLGAARYTIQSGRYVAWKALSEKIRVFAAGADYAAAEFSITRLLNGVAPTASVYAALVTFYNALDTLADIEDYIVPFERTADNVLRMLVEHGMDRAADLLTSLQITEFFGMHQDGVSYSTHLIRTAADVTRQVAPVSRFAKSLLGSPEVRLQSRRFLPT
jgi:hypothetical protein